PAAATETMYLDSNGNVVPGSSTFGARSVGVPGTVAGLRALWQQYGTMPWGDLVRPAAQLADSGFVVDSFLAADLAADKDSMTAFPATAAIFYPDGRPLAAGQRLIQKDLAATLFAIADEGPEVFYQGRIAALIDSCMKQYGGLITREDLAAYHPVWREPIHVRFDGVDIYSMAPPSSGGIVIGQILGLLEPFDFSRYTPTSPEYIHLFTEAARLAFADRAEHLGDPDFWKIPYGLLDSGYLAERRKLIDPEAAGSSEQVTAGNPFPFEHNQTTHFSVADNEGNMVAVTYTLNGSFGSRLTVPGAGFLLNNEMDDFAVKPGVPNKYGLVGGEANKIEPGKRMLSSMSPTIVLKDEKPFLVLGSPG
ncbi:MAG: gamma-glutamyltransferase, partial [Candidatus Zixiibacteriota bacterium]